MKCIIIAILSLLFTTTLYAQETGYNPGAIITRDNERIEGLVKNVNLVPARILDNIKFKRGEGEKVTSYSPAELAAYEINDDLFVSKKDADGFELFVKKFNTGKLQLYGALVFDGTASYNVKYTPYIQLQGDPVIHLVGQLSFRKQMLSYLKDAPNLCKLIDEKELKWKDISQIVALYNAEVGEQKPSRAY
ncbi:MAG TPA: hypothetical protein VGD40_05320 [Chryseosolibacter sp.]